MNERWNNETNNGTTKVVIKKRNEVTVTTPRCVDILLFAFALNLLKKREMLLREQWKKQTKNIETPAT